MKHSTKQLSDTSPLVALLIGKSARLDATADALHRSNRLAKLHILAEVSNPGLQRKVDDTNGTIEIGKSDDPDVVEEYARRVQPDFAVIGPEEPLAAGVVDRLQAIDIPCVGPTQNLACIESSKSFTRALFDKFQIPGGIKYRCFKDETGLEAYLRELDEFVIKPDGLTGGKGVKVFGDHFSSIKEGFAYCREVLQAGSTLVIEEKLEGEEFSLQSFCDGQTVVDMMPIQDHKRAWEGDRGPNTGGMGSYSCEDHKLPFLSEDDLKQAGLINKAVAQALLDETHEKYKGILYGSFMVTKSGMKVIEYNARFGDPEAINVLPLLKTDFIDVCVAIINGTLDRLNVEFERKATVCKYVVPKSYPEPMSGTHSINISNITPSEELRVFYGAVSGTNDACLSLGGSRAIALLGIGENLEHAEKIAERAASQIVGSVYHRSDIGTAALVQKRVDHMESLLGQSSSRPKFKHAV